MKKKVLVMAAMFCLLLAAAAARAETCYYDTAWGLLTINYNYNNNSVNGSYPHNGGTIAGTLFDDGHIEGQWWQNDGKGSFVFYLHQTGFSGKWNYEGDGGWRDAWDGQLRQCE